MPPMKKTQILDALPQDMPQNEIKKHKDNWTKILEILNSEKIEKHLTFQDFVSKLDMTEKEYILAIRSSISSQKVYLK